MLIRKESLFNAKVWSSFLTYLADEMYISKLYLIQVLGTDWNWYSSGFTMVSPWSSSSWFIIL